MQEEFDIRGILYLDVQTGPGSGSDKIGKPDPRIRPKHPDPKPCLYHFSPPPKSSYIRWFLIIASLESSSTWLNNCMYNPNHEGGGGKYALISFLVFLLLESTEKLRLPGGKTGIDAGGDRVPTTEPMHYLLRFVLFPNKNTH